MDRRTFVKGTAAAGYKILTTIVRVRLEPDHEPVIRARKAHKVHA